MKKIISVFLTVLMFLNTMSVNVLAYKEDTVDKVYVFIVDDSRDRYEESLGEYGLFDSNGEIDPELDGGFFTRYIINIDDIEDHKVEIKTKDNNSLMYIECENNGVYYTNDLVVSSEKGYATIKSLNESDDLLNVENGAYTIDFSQIDHYIETPNFKNAIYIYVDFYPIKESQKDAKEYLINDKDYLVYSVEDEQQNSHLVGIPVGPVDFYCDEIINELGEAMPENLLINTSVEQVQEPEPFFCDGYYFNPQYEVSYSFNEVTIDEEVKIGDPVTISGLATSLCVSHNPYYVDEVKDNYYYFGINNDGEKVPMQVVDDYSDLNENCFLYETNDHGTSIVYKNDGTILAAKKMIGNDFAFIGKDYKVAEIIDGDNLQDEVSKSINTPGNELVLSSNISLDSDLILTNICNSNGQDIGMNYENDICIDLKDKTLNLGNHSLYVERNSTVHIINGTITGSGDAVIKSYGHLHMKNVSVTNTNEDGGDAIWNIDGNVNIYSYDDNSAITATRDGIVMKNDRFSLSSRRYNSVLFQGQLIAERDGIVVDEHPSDMEYRVDVTAHEGVPNTEGHGVKIVATNGYGINAKDKAHVGIYGGNEEENGLIITGKTAIGVAGGDLFMDCPATYTSTDTDTPLIEIRQKGDNKQTAKLMTSYYFEATSNGPIVEEIGDSSESCITNFLISEQGGNLGTLISFGDDDLTYNPFNVKDNAIVKVLSGRYTKQSIENYIVKDVYEVVEEDDNYVVRVKEDDPSDYHFIYNENDSYENNLIELKHYLENIGTVNVYIDSNIPINSSDQSKVYDFDINYPKNVYYENYTLNNVKFNINLADDDTDHFGLFGGNILNTNSEIVELYSGTLHAMGNFENIDEGEDSCAFLIKGGHITTNEDLKPGNVKGNIAYKIRPERDIDVSIGGNTTGTSGVAIDYTRTNDTDGHVHVTENAVVNGKAVINNASFSIAGSLLSNDNGIEALDNAFIEINEKGTVDATDNGVVLDGTSVLVVSGMLNGFNAIECSYSDDQNPEVTIENRAHVSAAEHGEIMLLNTDWTSYDTDHRVVNSNFHVEGGFYNKPIDLSQFHNIDLVQYKDEQNEGSYRCVQYAPLDSDYPYTVPYMLVDQKNIYVNETEENTIEVDLNSLTKEIKNKDKSKNLVAVIASNGYCIKNNGKPEDAGFNKNTKEVVDIHASGKADNGDIESFDEISDYVFIKTVVHGEKYKGGIDNVVVEHKHGKDPVYSVEKVTKQVGESMKNEDIEPRECFYVEDENHIMLVTNKFSDFAFVDNDTVPEPDPECKVNPALTVIPWLVAKKIPWLIAKYIIDTKPQPTPTPTPTPVPTPDPKPTPTPTPKPKDTYTIPKTGVE